MANAPSSYALAVRGLQNCTFSQNSLENPDFKYELVGAVSARTLNSSVDAQVENFFFIKCFLYKIFFYKIFSLQN